MPDHGYFANLIWQIADLLRDPYRPPQYERVMLPMTVLRCFDCVLAPTKAKVLPGRPHAAGRLPSFQALRKGAQSRELEEERRNCFVAITRVEQTLTLTRAEEYYGYRKEPSQFLGEMGII